MSFSVKPHHFILQRDELVASRGLELGPNKVKQLESAAFRQRSRGKMLITFFGGFALTLGLCAYFVPASYLPFPSNSNVAEAGTSNIEVLSLWDLNARTEDARTVWNCGGTYTTKPDPSDVCIQVNVSSAEHAYGRAFIVDQSESE